MQKRVLLADNNPDFLKVWAEYLELEGYQVFTAGNPQEAREMILRGNIQLAILDKRLVSDLDENDTSGITLANDPELVFLSSLIITDYPEQYEHVRAALLPGVGRAVDFISKRDGPDSMLAAVAHAFQVHIPINFDLQMDWDDSGLSVRVILDRIDKGLDDGEFSWRCQEMEDLLRMVFYEFTDVTIFKRLWSANGRVALLACGHTGQADRVVAVTLGHQEVISTELDHQKAFPDDPGEGGTTHAGFYRRARYAANAWRLSGMDIEQAEPLLKAAVNLKENQFSNVLAKMFQVTLAAWKKQREPLESEGSAVDTYRQFFPLFQLEDPDRLFRDRVSEVARHARRYNLLQEIVIDDHEWRIEITPRLALTFPDPCGQLFYSAGAAGSLTNYTQCSPGELKLNTILLGGDQVTWLTDFARVHELPIWHDFACMECELRFSLLETTNLDEILHFETQLRPSWPVLPRSGVDTTADLRKTAAAILKVREQAEKFVRKEPHLYAQCLLVNALAELLEWDPPVIRTKKDAARLVHRLILAGCVCLDLAGDRQQSPVIQYPPLQVDADGTVHRGNEIIYLTETEQKLLTFLYANEGKFCERDVICKEVFGILDPGPGQLQGQIDANLNRLRKKIEPDPENPHYLITMYRRGVRLVKAP